MDDVEGDGFRGKSGVFRRRLRFDDHGLVAVGGVLAARRLAVDQDMALLEPELQAAARELRHEASHDLVEALAAGLRIELQGDRAQVDAARGKGKLGNDIVVEIGVQG